MIAGLVVAMLVLSTLASGFQAVGLPALVLVVAPLLCGVAIAAERAGTATWLIAVAVAAPGALFLGALSWFILFVFTTPSW